MAQAQPLLSLRNIVKTFSGVKARAKRASMASADEKRSSRSIAWAARSTSFLLGGHLRGLG